MRDGWAEVPRVGETVQGLPLAAQEEPAFPVGSETGGVLRQDFRSVFRRVHRDGTIPYAVDELEEPVVDQYAHPCQEQQPGGWSEMNSLHGDLPSCPFNLPCQTKGINAYRRPCPDGAHPSR